MTGKSRKQITVISSIVIAVAAAVVSLGYKLFYFEAALPGGGTGQILDIMDYVSNNLLMPIVCLITCIIIGWVVKPKWIIEEVEQSGHIFSRKKLYSVMIKYIVPVLMVMLLLQSLGVFKLLGI